MELDWICVSHRPHLSLLMCCHEAAASSSHARWREPSGVSSSGDEHMNVWLRELLCDQGMNYPDSLWLGSFRLSASLCIRYGARAGRGPLAVPYLELRACRFPSPLTAAFGALFTSQTVRWFLGDGAEYWKAVFKTWPVGTIWRIGCRVYPELTFHTCTTQREVFCTDAFTTSTNPPRYSGERWSSRVQQEVTY